MAAGIAALLALGGCTGMSDTQQRTLTGGVGGAAVGGVVGAIAGNTGLGLAIGAGAGLAGGYLYDQHKKSEEKAYQQGVAAGKSQATKRPPTQPQSNPSN